MRDLAMLLVMGGLLFYASRTAYSAWLLWAWASLVGVQTFMYGFMRGVSYVQWFALLTLVLIVMRKDPVLARAHTSGPQRYRMDGVSLLMLMLAVHGVLSATFGFPDLPRMWEICTNLLKIVLLCLLMPLLVTDRLRIQVLAIAIVMALSVHGLLDGLKFLASGGAHMAGTFSRLGDRNDFALHMVMVLPLMAFLLAQLKGLWARLLTAGVMGLTVLAVVATQSRGGLVSLVAVGVWMVFRSGRKLLAATLVAGGAVLVVTLAPANWFERMETIGAAKEDGSFMGRVQAWKRASAIALDNPVFGGGFRSVQAPSLFERYRDSQGFLGFIDSPRPDFARAAHSIYFEVMSDVGLVGLGLFLAVMLSGFAVGARVRRRAKAIGPSARWAADLATYLNVAMVAYLVGGAALSLAWVDLPYVLVMMVATLDRIMAKEQDRLKREALAAAPAATAPVQRPALARRFP
jgi:probable O-glycosylation ligase (exosortase A-associated)